MTDSTIILVILFIFVISFIKKYIEKRYTRGIDSKGHYTKYVRVRKLYALDQFNSSSKFKIVKVYDQFSNNIWPICGYHPPETGFPFGYNMPAIDFKELDNILDGNSYTIIFSFSRRKLKILKKLYKNKYPKFLNYNDVRLEDI